METRAASRRRTVRVALIVAAVLAGTAAAYLAGRRSHRPVPSYQQLTFRRGVVHGARFAPDGQTVVYAASWSGRPSELFSTRIGSTESRPLGVTGRLLSISRRGDIAVKLGASPGAEVTSGLGTLARVSLAGGALRELLNDVRYAAWDVAGRELAVLRRADGKMRLEYPIGRPVYEPSGLVLYLRFLPDESLVFFEQRRDGFALMRLDRQGKASSLTTGWVEPCGLGPWSEATGEVWFAGISGSRYEDCALHAVTLSGRVRLVARVPGDFRLTDLDPSGRLLLNRAFVRRGIVCLVPGESRERDLSWLGSSQSPDLSADGRTIVFSDLAAGTGGLAYLRSTDGAPAVRLGEGGAFSLSPDGRWVLAGPNGPDDHLLLLPTGPGEPRRLQHPSIRRYFDARWFPDGQRILVVGGEVESRARLYAWDLEGGAPRPLSPEMKKAEQYGDVAVSPDGAWVAAAGSGTPLMLFPTQGGEARAVPGREADDRPRGWSADGRWLVVRRAGTWLPMRIDRLDVRTGERQPWTQVAPDDPTGVIMSWGFAPTPDGRGYAYSYMSSLSTLYLVEGLE